MMKSFLHTLIVAVLATAGSLGPVQQPRAEQLSEAKIIFEINASAGDGGIQIFVDGEQWKRLEVFDPTGQKIFDVFGSSSIGVTGLTELFFESAEPSFADLPLDQLLLRFPQGTYRFEGVTVAGARLAGMATLSHTLPAGPTVVAPAEGSTLPANAPVVINWNPVTQPYPGTTSPITISGYQVIVERDRRKSPVAFNVTLPPTVTRVTVPPEFIQAKREYKFEVLAIDKSGNQTITEGNFKTGP